MRPRVDVTPLQELLTIDTSPELLKERIENIRYNYTQYALKDTDACGGQPDIAEDAFYLKLLEDRLVEILERQAGSSPSGGG